MEEANAGSPGSTWRSLYRMGAAAALLAGIVFRRNIAAEVALFGVPAPTSVAGWFALLRENRLLGLTFLNIFDVVDYALVGLMLLALCAALWRVSKSASAIATAAGLAGAAIYLASNTSLAMLALSDQYASAATDAERSMLLAAGRAALALGQGTGAYSSLLLLAIAGLLFSLLMLRSAAFGRWAAYLGILAAALDLVYCVAYVLVPATSGDLVAILTLPAAGLLLMVWHILVGFKLLRLGRQTRTAFTQ